MIPIGKISDVETAAILWRVDEIRTDQLPEIACDLLEAGVDTLELRMLAGLTSANIEQAPTLFYKILDDAGYGMLPLVRAIRGYIKLIAQNIVSGKIEPYQGALMISRATIRTHVKNFHGADPFIYAADEYEDRPEDREFFREKIITEAKELLGHRG